MRMTLEQLGKLVTSLKTSATHLGVKHSDIRVIFVMEDNDVKEVQMDGKGEDGTIHITVTVL